MEEKLCFDCPRLCGATRGLHKDEGKGFCKTGRLPVVARAAAHFGEEPCISGTKGSGTVFFSGCNLGCVYCQNHEISKELTGKEITVDELKQIYRSLISQGVHNIELVTPSHFKEAVAQSLNEKLPVPVVYNTGGYDSVNTVKLLHGKIDVYMPDFKYSDSSVAKKYSFASDYREVALQAISAMLDSVGEPQFNDDGLMVKGVLIRHLLLPHELDNTLGCIEDIASRFKNKVVFSLMSRYTPVCEVNGFANLNCRVTEEEYEKAVNYVHLCGIKRGYFQSPSSAEKSHIPAFDLTGV